jgi:hypothetical protein
MTTTIDMSRFHREITAPLSGQKFIIRRVRFLDFIAEIGGSLPTPNSTIQDLMAQLESKSGDPQLEEKTTKFYLSRGIVAPKIWFGDEAECPTDQIFHADVAADFGTLISEIISYSTLMTTVQQTDSPNGAAADPTKLTW